VVAVPADPSTLDTYVRAHAAVNRLEGAGQVARHFIDGDAMKEGILNRVSAVVRAYDPCLSCSTQAGGTPDLEIALKGPGFTPRC
jgi:coenzyme F420-reducing hydrogenase alpha subunit